MYNSIIDSHIHLDVYKKVDRKNIIDEMEKYHIEQLITVSMNLASAIINLSLSRNNPRVNAAFGFHPEQPLPREQELDALCLLIKEYHHEMIAIGEVGLPYYRQRENPKLELEPYIEILEHFILESKRYDKPIVLHAIYEHAPIVCDLLEKHTIEKAHFHWYKGDKRTTERLIQNGYDVSITPDVLYDKEIQQLVKDTPIDHMMLETDGPWKYKGAFLDKMTHPKMIHWSIAKIAEIKNLHIEDIYAQIYRNTKEFYCLD
ncbi:TatD family deoxyribonuclease [Oceanobacillus halophilus]|uniref:TatD family deoxyribonuclease n=2 Tax=Oceanobacillus halophilus TaxID=930130 RepID=A0A495A8K9_9BACI|nr:TatD family deoxyribonuclease [Oceanobacillus halophilus]